MLSPFRSHHLFQILQVYETTQQPLDLLLRKYFRKHRSVGSKDRKEIAETVYSIIRWKGLLDALISSSATWKKRHDLLASIHPEDLVNSSEIPLHHRLSFPKSIVQRLVSTYGSEQTQNICLASNTRAPTSIRVNTLKTSRKKLFKAWKEKYQVRLCQSSPDGIIFEEKINFFASQEFKNGLFEIQDEASQLVSRIVQAEPGQKVLDYCSGSGGKSLAIAPFMQGKGQLFLHDIRPHILQEAKKRLKRAGIQNAQTLPPTSSHLKLLKKKMDWVLVDAPCSGSGTIRRNPDMKWKFTDAMLEELLGMQKNIFEKALSYLAPNGKIVYATCSIFQEENEEQLQHFLKTYPLKVHGPIFKSLPSIGKMDGFFAVCFEKI